MNPYLITLRYVRRGKEHTFSMWGSDPAKAEKTLKDALPGSKVVFVELAV